MSAHCEECYEINYLDEDGLCGGCASSAPAVSYWSPVGTETPAWGSPRGAGSPAPGSARCESCGGWGQLDERGICAGCVVTDQRQAERREAMVDLTARAEEAAAYAQAHGTIPDNRYEDEDECPTCGRQISTFEAQDYGACIRCYDQDSPR